MFNTLVIGPDVILNYPDIISDPQDPTETLSLYQLVSENSAIYGVANSTENGTPPHELNFIDANLIIPEICIKVLEETRNSKGPKAHAATLALSRLNSWIKPKNSEAAANMDFSPTNIGDQRITLLALTKEFKDDFIFDVPSDDISGITAATAFVASKSKQEVYLITNNLATSLIAKEYGIQTLPFIPRPEPEYTGIRHMVFPDSLCMKFYDDECIHLNDFWYVFPDHKELVPNEYIITYAEGNAREKEFLPGYYKKTKSGTFIGLLNPNCDTVKKSAYPPEEYHESIFRYDAKREALVTCDVDRFIPANNPELAAYKDALGRSDIDVIIVTGAAGTGKSYSAFEYALDACTSGEFMHAYVVKEGKNDLGAVPGEVDDKMMPLIQYGKDALRSIALDNNKEVRRRMQHDQKYGVGNDKAPKESKKHRRENNDESLSNGEGKPKSVYELLNNIVDLQWDNNFTAVPYEQIQGRTLKKAFIIIDEFQRVSAEQADTILTRLGEASKMIIIGDIAQAQGYSTKRPVVDGITYASLLYKGSPNVAQIKLDRGMRHRVVEYAINRRDRVLSELGLPTD